MAELVQHRVALMDRNICMSLILNLNLFSFIHLPKIGAALVNEQLATKRDLKELEMSLVLRLGGIIVAGIAVIATLVKILKKRTHRKTPSQLRMESIHRMC